MPGVQRILLCPLKIVPVTKPFRCLVSSLIDIVFLSLRVAGCGKGRAGQGGIFGGDDGKAHAVVFSDGIQILLQQCIQKLCGNKPSELSEEAYYIDTKASVHFSPFSFGLRSNRMN